MVEPISSVLAVATTCASVGDALYRFATTISHAQREIQTIAKNITHFSTLLYGLDETLEDVPKDLLWSVNVDYFSNELVRESRKAVRNFKRFKKDLRPLADGAGASRLMARVKWYFKKAEVLFLLSSLEALKSSLQVWNTTLQLRILSKKPRVGAEGDRLQKRIERLENQLDHLCLFMQDVLTDNARLRHQLKLSGGSMNIAGVAKIALRTAETQLNQSRESPKVSAESVEAVRPSTSSSGTEWSYLSPPKSPSPAPQNSPPPSGEPPTDRMAFSLSSTGEWEFDESEMAQRRRLGIRVRDSKGELVHEEEDDSSKDSDR